ncbi:MAG: helix-turn-helix domain-containing protein [Lactobacillales bacterium]|jgi:transcriptional regulator with XRE-family HTH domain|nr:helix-turn-helix domain-containing protein [Lactobacillales bacterium]
MKEMNLDILGTMVKKARIKQGYTQGELAGILSQSRISEFENDKCDIMAKDLIRILEKIEMPIAEFFYDSKNASLEEIVENIVDATADDDVAAIEAVYEKTKKYPPTTRNLLESMCYVLSCRVRKDKIKKTKTAWLVQYLNELKWYSKLDLAVLNNCIVIFKKEDLVAHFDHTLMLLGVENRKDDEITLMLILLNIIMKLLADNELELARQLRSRLTMTMLSQAIIATCRMIDAIFMYRDDKANEAMEYMQQTILAIDIFDHNKLGFCKEMAKVINFQEAVNSAREKKNYREYYELIGIVEM